MERKSKNLILNLGFIMVAILINGMFVIATAQEIQRISVNEAKAKTVSGKALLVCAYSDQHCADLMLPGAIKRSQFESRVKSLPMDAEIIFYCA
jgi:hypothetical protein